VRLFYDLTGMPWLLVAIACGLTVVLFAGALVLASIRRSRASPCSRAIFPRTIQDARCRW
jgi:hypothetical protein